MKSWFVKMAILTIVVGAHVSKVGAAEYRCEDTTLCNATLSYNIPAEPLKWVDTYCCCLPEVVAGHGTIQSANPNPDELPCPLEECTFCWLSQTETAITTDCIHSGQPSPDGWCCREEMTLEFISTVNKDCAPCKIVEGAPMCPSEYFGPGGPGEDPDCYQHRVPNPLVTYGTYQCPN